MDALGALFSSSLALYLVYGRQVGSSNTGFSLNMAVQFSSSVLWTVRMFNLIEVQANRQAIFSFSLRYNNTAI